MSPKSPPNQDHRAYPIDFMSMKARSLMLTQEPYIQWRGLDFAACKLSRTEKDVKDIP